MTTLESTAAATPTAPTAEPAEAAPPWRALPVLLAGTVLIVLDFFIVNVALPSMQRQLHATQEALEWVVAGYGLGFAALQMVAGQLGDRWGHRRIFGLGVALFTLTSAACGLAPDQTTLVVARVAQGAAGALIGPTVLALIGVLFTGAHRARAVGVYATVMGVAAVSGQLVGGLLLALEGERTGWRTVFLINLPIGVTTLVLLPRLVPQVRSTTRPRIDVPGLLLVGTGLTALVLPLLQGRALGWPAWTLECLAAAPLLLGGFVLQQRRLVRRGGDPLLDPALFRSRAFSAGMLAQVLLWAGQASYFLVLALFLQQGLGLSPLAAGGVFTVVAAAYLVSSIAATPLAARGGRRVVAAGAALLAAGHLALTAAVVDAGPRPPIPALVPGLLLAGTGMGLAITALTATVLAGAEPRTAGAVSGALSTTQQVGNAVGVALIGLLFFGAVDRGVDTATAVSLEALAGLLAVLAVVAGLALPPRVRS